ncbi:MAG: hypothetical protein JW789_01800 [Candidatus Aenigmarchaeota archaeon]|nr:hypothetical protein [Candidatus Aenigmarchaeota archaeon]
MSIEIITEKDNPLRKRKEYWLSADHYGEGTPNRHDLMKAVVKKLATKEELTLLDKIFSERGRAKSRIKVIVYSDRKDVPSEKIERQTRKVSKYLEKHTKKEEAPAEEAPAEENGDDAKEEAPSEEEKPAEDTDAEPAEEALQEEKGDETPSEEDEKEKKRQ